MENGKTKNAGKRITKLKNEKKTVKQASVKAETVLDEKKEKAAKKTTAENVAEGSKKKNSKTKTKRECSKSTDKTKTAESLECLQDDFLFHEGTDYKAYNFLGARPQKRGG